MRLYEIESALLECVDEETGELIDEEKLSQLMMERDTKIENIALWIKDLDADAEAIKAEKMALAKRQQTAENKAESLRRFLSNYLAGAKFSTAKVAISYRKSESVEIAEDAVVPEAYMEYKPSVKKAELKKALKEGMIFEGISLATNNNIQIK